MKVECEFGVQSVAVVDKIIEIIHAHKIEGFLFSRLFKINEILDNQTPEYTLTTGQQLVSELDELASGSRRSTLRRHCKIYLKISLLIT